MSFPLIASVSTSRRQSSRPTSIAGASPRRLSVTRHSLSRHTFLDTVLDRRVSDSVLPPTLNSTLGEEDEEGHQEQQELEQQQADDGCSPLWPVSTTKRCKRGRKGKGMTPSMDHIQTSELLASASQTLSLSSAARRALPPLLSHSLICRRLPGASIDPSRHEAARQVEAVVRDGCW